MLLEVIWKQKVQERQQDGLDGLGDLAKSRSSMETSLPPEPDPCLSSTSCSPPAPAPDSTITPYSAPFTEGEDILVHLEDGLIYFGVVVEVEQEQGQCLVRFGDCTERWSSFFELRRLGGDDEDESPPPTPVAVSSSEKSEPVGIQALHEQLARIETVWQQEVSNQPQQQAGASTSLS